MALVRCGNGLTDIRGSISGVYFHRDKSGLHCSTRPRIIYRKSLDQKVQRNAFIAARTLSTDNRTVSYLMYRYLNGLPITIVPEWMSPTGWIVSSWVNEQRAIDGNPVSNSWKLVSARATTEFLTLTLPPSYTDRIRFDCLKSVLPDTGMDLDVIRDGISVHVFPSGDGFSNDYNDHAWTEKTFQFTLGLVTRIELRFDNQFDFDSFTARVYEIEYWNRPPHWPVPVDYKIPRL